MFKDILFTLSHDTIMVSSEFTVSINEGKSLPVQKKLESSANNMATSLGETRARSFIYNRKSSGPKFEQKYGYINCWVCQRLEYSAGARPSSRIHISPISLGQCVAKLDFYVIWLMRGDNPVTLLHKSVTMWYEYGIHTKFSFIFMSLWNTKWYSAPVSTLYRKTRKSFW